MQKTRTNFHAPSSEQKADREWRRQRLERQQVAPTSEIDSTGRQVNWQQGRRGGGGGGGRSGGGWNGSNGRGRNGSGSAATKTSRLGTDGQIF